MTIGDVYEVDGKQFRVTDIRTETLEDGTEISVVDSVPM